MSTPLALVTGFEAYGGRQRNPAGEIATQLDGVELGGARVVGRNLPVAARPLEQKIPALLAELEPAVVISLGLRPGAPVIRLERLALNLADFAIPDNEGVVLIDQPLDAGATAGRFATLPLRPIQHALLEAGVPARLSNSAGTYLCNKALYRFLGAIEQRGLEALCGFIHLPYLPEQVAHMIAEVEAARSLAWHRPTELGSMSLETMIAAVRIALEVTLAERARPVEALPSMIASP